MSDRCLDEISAVVIRMAGEFDPPPGDAEVIDFRTAVLWSPRNILPALAEGLISQEEAARAIVDRTYGWLSGLPGAVRLSTSAGDWDHYIDEVRAALRPDR